MPTRDAFGPSADTANQPPEPSVAAELEASPYEPLSAIEKKLIAWCLILGVLLLGVLLWASATFFPAT
jgi:hypothetical protein